MLAFGKYRTDHHHHHDGHEFERLEGRLAMIAAGIGVFIGLAMAIGLFAAQGHVTW